MTETERRLSFSVSLLRLTVHHVAFQKTVILVKIMWFNIEVVLNVFVQVPGLVFIVHHKEQRKLLVHISPLSLGALSFQGARSANDQRPQETAIQVLEM